MNRFSQEKPKNKGEQQKTLKNSPPKLPRIAFVGPIAESGKPACGGFEAANRRTIDLLQKQSVQVIEYPYPIVEGSTLRKSIAYSLRFVSIAANLIRHKKAWDILHITPLLRQFITAEALVCQVAIKLRRPLFFDIRAGNLIGGYNARGKRYQQALARLIGSAVLLAIEGRKYADFVRPWYNKEIFYFPNYAVWQPKYEENNRLSPEKSGEIRLVTLGRVVANKGIQTAIEIVAILQNAGFSAKLEIIGAGESTYIKQLKTRYAALPVHFTGPLSPENVQKKLSACHFFIFATTHVGEGHSNALTEAMAHGVVPLCSDNGFNQDVVGEAGVILPQTANAQSYVDVMQKIFMKDAAWQAASQQAHERIRANFSDLIIIPKLIEKYHSILQT
jgi:glycosyltransferase involved in cell wall biosynthesis